ncbi:MAG TPA: hydantoinase/carbamoylase family amidase [Acetobacteraceae bacterium]|nr:hydantoinase/carbamoylase family amidase [Acetobacteraceae bacterium]
MVTGAGAQEAVTAGAIAAAVAAERGRAAALFDRLRADGEDPPGVTRDPYGPGEQRGHATVAAEAARMGLDLSRDAAANLYATLPGRDRAAPRIILGSHLDSVPHGGNFDGAAGVVAGLVAVAALRRLGIAPACDVTVMGIRAEESIWFQVSYIGSRGALGSLPEGALDARRIDTGRSLAEHIADCGGDPAALAAGHRHFDPATVRAYLELHIEQAPSLVAAGRPVAICTGIPGNFRYPDARIEGSDDHVGLPRRFRRDAAMAGAAFAMGIDRIWEAHEARGIPMAATIGRFHTDPARHGLTIVPGAFHFSLDVRAYDESVLAALDRDVSALVAGIEQQRGVRFHLGTKARAAVGLVDPGIRAGLAAAAAALGVSVLDLGSPASHDAAAFAQAGVKMGMVFVRNAGGSHNPNEAMELDDFLAGTAVLTHWLAGAVSA